MSPADLISVGDLEVRRHEHVVLAHGREVPLTTREFDIVVTLAEHPGWVFSADQLVGDQVTGDYSPESVRVLVSRLRQKLSDAGVVPDVIETVRGIGYRIAPPAGESSATAEAEAGRELREAAWQLQEAVIEVVHTGTVAQQRDAIEVLEDARRALFGGLAT